VSTADCWLKNWSLEIGSVVGKLGSEEKLGSGLAFRHFPCLRDSLLIAGAKGGYSQRTGKRIIDWCSPSSGGGGDPPGDPCKGLRDQMRDHERKLREYMANPMASDNKGFLAGALAKNDQDLYNKIYLSRIASLQAQIANFKKQLEECERRNGL